MIISMVCHKYLKIIKVFLWQMVRNAIIKITIFDKDGNLLDI